MKRKSIILLITSFVFLAIVSSLFAQVESKPVSEEKKPVVEEKKATVSEEKKTPVVEEKKPVTEEKKPVVEEKKAPAVEEKKAVAEEKKPVVEEKKAPIPEEKKPTIPEEKKAPVEEKKPTVLVESLEGTVRVQIAGKTEWETLKPGMTLSAGDTISVYARSQVTLKYAEDRTVKINENSMYTIKQLKVTPEAKETTSTLWVGKVNTKIKKLQAAEKFEIHTPVAVCAVRGTDFDVEVAEDKSTKVKVFEGNVGVKEITGLGGEVLVGKGQQSVVKPGVAPTPAEAIPPEKAEVPKPEVAKPEAPGLAEAPAPPEEKKEEKKPAAPAGKKPFNMAGSFGSVTLTDKKTGKQKVYSRLSLMPEIVIGKIGVGLDLNFYFDEDNRLRKEDWDSWDDIPKKIVYVRYGQKRDPLYVFLGGFRAVSIGHGLIMNRYSNMLEFPDVRKLGFELDIDRGKWGFESVITDLNRVDVFGARPYLRPFRLLGINPPVINKLAVGFTSVVDRNPNSDKSVGAFGKDDDWVSVSGLDLDLPVLEKKAFSMLAFADIARLSLGKAYDVGVTTQPKSGGMGYAFGFTGNLLVLFNYRLEYRAVENNFVAGYFDTYYDRDRDTKAWSISPKRKPFKKGPYAELTLNLMNKINFILCYEDYNLDPADYYPAIHSEFVVDPALLFNKYSFSFAFDKRNVRFKRLFKLDENTLVTTQVGYQLGGNVSLIVTNKKTFAYDPVEKKYKSVTRTNIETKLQF